MKYKLHLIALLLLSFTTSTFASTNVPAVIASDAQWDASGNPYVIQGKVVVAKGATLHIGPNVQVVFQGPAAMEVNGTLDVQGSAAAPAVFRMTDAGLQSELYINGGEADLTSTKILSGVFLSQDAHLTLQGVEITKGSGIYLKGATVARIKNTKIYGNATGVVLDGQVKATLEFVTITQNTYGLFLKSYSDLNFKNNSIHDNDKEVVNNTPAIKLGGNYWGDDPNAAQAKIQGSVDIAPTKTLKDLLRVYIRTQLPVITKEMSLALVAKEKREAQEEAEALKKLKNAQPEPPAAAPPAEVAAPAPPAEQAAPAEQPAPAAAEAAAPPAEEAPAETTQTAQVKPLPPSPHTLKPLDNLPPDQGNVAEAPAGVPSASSAEASAPAEAPEAPAPPAAVSSTTPPAAGGSEIPLPPSDNSTVAAPPPPASTDNSVPVPPEVSSSQPPAIPSSDVIAPPSIESSTAPPAAASSTAASSPEAVPAPPDLSEQVPPASAATAASTSQPPAAGAASTTPPPPPVPTGSDNTSPASTASVAPPVADNSVAPPAPPVSDNSAAAATATSAAQPAQAAVPQPSAADQQKGVDALNGVSGDIDGMQAPPLDLGIDVQTTPTSGAATNSQSSSSDTNPKKTSDAGVALPPIKDSDVAPPKDLDLPPTDDLGNVNLDSKNK